jgi:hypothetical protein
LTPQIAATSWPVLTSWHSNKATSPLRNAVISVGKLVQLPGESGMVSIDPSKKRDCRRLNFHLRQYEE